MSKIRFLLIVFITSILIPLPVHAYAGPGAAIGAIIVLITIVFAFFGSIFISILIR